VNVFARRDNKGKIVRDITKDDFALSEEGRPQVHQILFAGIQSAADVGLLVDTSMSQRRVLGVRGTGPAKAFPQVLRGGQGFRIS